MEKPIDVEKEKIRKTRPRLIMTPSIDIDSSDVKIYNLLVEDKYTTQMMKDYGHGWGTSSVKARLDKRYAPTMPLSLPKYFPPYVSPEWRMDSASWDRRQRRDYCDATKVFWLNKSNERYQRTL